MDNGIKKDLERFGRGVELGTGKIVEKSGKYIDYSAKKISSQKENNSSIPENISKITDSKDLTSSDERIEADNTQSSNIDLNSLGINTSFVSDRLVESDSLSKQEEKIDKNSSSALESKQIEKNSNSKSVSSLSNIKTLCLTQNSKVEENQVEKVHSSLLTGIKTLETESDRDVILEKQNNETSNLNEKNILSFLNEHTFNFQDNQGKISKMTTVVGKTTAEVGKFAKKGVTISRKISKSIDGEDSTGFGMLNSEMQRNEVKAGRVIATKVGKNGWSGIKKATKSSVQKSSFAVKKIQSFVSKISSQVLASFKVAVSSFVKLIAPFLPAILGAVTVFGIILVLLASVAGASGACGQYKNVKPCDLGNSIKDIAWANQSWNRNSEQFEIFNCDEGGCSPSSSPKEGTTDYGNLKKDDLGFYYIEENGTKFYCNAMSSYYTSQIGDKFRITTDEGNVFYIIIADQKADQHTHAGNNDNNSHCLSASGGMLEFYVDRHSFIGGTLNQNFDDDHQFKGAVTKVERLTSATGCPSGTITGDPDFSNSDAWRAPNNPYASVGLYGQCTWFAWGRFYELYGYSPGFTGNGFECVSQLLASHPDKFEFGLSPKVGAVGSSDLAHNHVWIVTGVEGDKITIQEGNLNGKTDSWEVAITDWQTKTYTMAGLKQAYGMIVFANPK